VRITGSFLTGAPLRVPTEEYDNVRASLIEYLSSAFGWQCIHPLPASGTYHSGGGFGETLPLVLLRRDGAEVVSRLQALVENEVLALPWPTALERVQIDVYDLGVANLTLTLMCDLPADANAGAVAKQMKSAVWLRPQGEQMAALPAALRQLVAETTTQFKAAALVTTPGLLQETWTLPSIAKSDHGRLMWLHPIHVVRQDVATDRRQTALDLAPAFCRDIGLPDCTFITGIGWSAIALAPGSDSDQIAMRLIEMHYAYIALYMEIDRGLLQALEYETGQTFSKLSHLEHEADLVFNNFMRVMEARARVDTTLAGLGGDEQGIWDAMNEVSRFDALVAGVDRKVEVLQRVTDRRVQQATTVSARRSTRILGFLTALTVVTVAVALIGSFIGNRSDALGHLPARFAVVGTALLVAIGVYKQAFNDRVTTDGLRRRRSRRRQHGR
jgi:hypothetical protein